MSKQSDNANLAKRYVDLWQKQTALMAADPRFAEAIGHVMARLSPEPNAGDGPAERERDNSGTEPIKGPGQEPGSATEVGAAPDGTASHIGDDLAAELARRIAECEARIAALASDAGDGGGNPDD